MKKIDCFKCKYFYITWEPDHPRGCKAFGFKTIRMPSQVVKEESGKECLRFLAKDEPKSEKRQGWIA